MKYKDLNGNACTLSFSPGEFSLPSRHVLVICRTGDDWLLTRHSLRGLEFPGGKAEEGETLEQAARRELREETGFIAEELEWFAEYGVESDPPFVKTVFTGTAERSDAFSPMETEGPVLAKEVVPDESYSFLMKDDGMKAIIDKLNKQETAKAQKNP